MVGLGLGLGLGIGLGLGVKGRVRDRFRGLGLGLGLGLDNYSYINQAFMGRQVFQQPKKTQLHKMLIFSVIQKNGPCRTVIPYLADSKFCYQQKSLIR